MSMFLGPLETLIIDIGGVILTNGWDTACRKRAVAAFALDEKTVEGMHRLNFDSYERGLMTLEDYIKRVFFYTPQKFTHEEVLQFIFSQSQPLQDMIDLIAQLKKKHHFKVYAISNEGREIMDYRAYTFNLRQFIDGFFVSGYLGRRKPDYDIFQLALDVTQADMRSTLYFDDRQPFVEVMQTFGIQSYQHTNFASTKEILESALNQVYLA